MTVKDGPNSLYQQAKIKILHLLKQPTKDNRSIPELIDIMPSLGREFMYRVALRSYAIQNGYPDWENLPNNEQILLDALKKSGIVNLENNICAPSTNINDVFQLAIKNKNKERWFNAIKEASPNIVLCGGTYDAVKKALESWGKKLKENPASTGMKYFLCIEEMPTTPFLDTPHPSARYPLSMVHTYIVKSAKEIMEHFQY